MHGDSSGSVGTSVAVPYLGGEHASHTDPAVVGDRTKVRAWRNLETFQVLCPGLDGQYSDVSANPQSSVDRYRFRFSLTGLNFQEYDFDNMGNFSEGRLEDELQ